MRAGAWLPMKPPKPGTMTQSCPKSNSLMKAVISKSVRYLLNKYMINTDSVGKIMLRFLNILTNVIPYYRNPLAKVMSTNRLSRLVHKKSYFCKFKFHLICEQYKW